MPLTFPYDTLKAASFQLDIAANVISGGITNGGYQQRVNTGGGGLWKLRLGFNRLSTPYQLRAWRAIQYGGDGGVTPINISICDMRQAPRPNGPHGSGVPHSDDSPFGDGSLYSSPLIVAELTSYTAARATTVRMTFDNDSVPVGGEYFSLPYGDGFHELHVIISVTPVSDGVFDAVIRPPLRAAHAAGEQIEFDHPTGTFVQSDPDAMSMATDYGRWGRGEATFLEYLGAM